MNKESGAGLKIEHTGDRRAALDGASFVLNATAIGRNRLWKLDYDIPKKYGIRQTLGENGGPGGLFFTLRTLPMVFDFARDIEEKCPGALLINFSNPESRIILALAKYSHVRAVGLCEGIFGGRNHVAHIMDIPAAEIDVWGAGLNHCGRSIARIFGPASNADNAGDVNLCVLEARVESTPALEALPKRVIRLHREPTGHACKT